MAVKRLKRRQRLGKYRVEGRLAEGGFAVVYRATDLIEGIQVALKIPHPESTSTDDVKALEREVRLIARLEHPNILPLKDASIIDGLFLLVSPLGKETLHDRLCRRTSAPMMFNYAEQAIAAVAYAHRQRVLHCDIKPENYILFEGDRLRLGDFGIARVAQHTRAQHGSGTGTVGYIAPEQALGRPSFRSDVFSLCLVLYRMFSGHLPTWPFAWPLPGLEKLKDRGGPELASLLKKGLDVDDRKRFKDAAELEAAFEGLRRKQKKPKTEKKPAAKKPERTRAPTMLLGERMEACRMVRAGPGVAAVFTTRRPDASPERKNQDAVAIIPAGGERVVLLVADGCGGLPSPAKASRLCASEMQRALVEGPSGRRPLRDVMLDGMERANKAILGLKRGAGSTLAAVCVEGDCAQPVHVGDAGVVVCGQRGLIKLRTLPHGPVGDALRAGILDEEDAPFHEESHVVSNLVGSHEMWIELGPKVSLAQRDTIVIGSDGLFGNLTAEEIVSVTRHKDLQKAGDTLAKTCLQRMVEPAPHMPPSPDDLGFVLFRRS